MAYMKDSSGFRLDDFAAYRPVARPAALAAFTRLPEPAIYRLGNARFGVQMDTADLLPAGGTTYYVDRAGSSGNTGLSPASPWNIATAIAAVNAGPGGDTIVLLVSNDEYPATTWATITKSCNIVAAGPGCRVSAWLSSATWTAVSGTAGVAGTIYSTPKVLTNGVFDTLNLTLWTDRNGRTHRNYTQHVGKGTGANQAAALALITGDGQYAFDSTNLYYRPTGAMDLTNTTTRKNIRLRQSTTVGISASGPGVVVRVRNISFEGHTTFGSSNNAILIAEDCSMKYALNDATTIQGGHAIMLRCTASGNGRDGFNYHDVAGNNSEIIEVDCVSGYNGLQDTNDNNNGSTAHETCRIVRVNGSYAHTTGPTIADVNTSQSWNLGCDARDSIAISSTQQHNWRTDTTAVMYLDECSSNGVNVGSGSGTGLTFKASDSSQIHLSGFKGAVQPLAVEASGTGSVAYYDAMAAA